MEQRIELERAAALLTQGASPLGVENLPLSGCLGRVLAEDCLALQDQPPFDRSPLDGYALRAADLEGASPERPARLAVVDRVCAGDVARVGVEPGQAVRIMTGAMLPAGADCVVRQEDTDRGEPVVSVYVSLGRHANYVFQGEDYRAGSRLLPAGTVLDAAAVGLLAGAGLARLNVCRLPFVAVLSTGDEVVQPHVRPLPPGKIYGSNLHLILARLRELGFQSLAGEQAGDDPARVARAMGRLLETYDVLITTGGVSEGDKDVLHAALPLLGAEQVFWRVRAKPGTPAMFSHLGGKPILSISGNPFACAATFELLARPLLAALSANPALLPRRARAALTDGFSKPSPQRRFARGICRDGAVTPAGKDSPGLLSSFVGCNCLIDIPAGSPALEAGAQVDVLML